jgi:hypothetical protein
MADHSKPTLTSTYTNFVTEVDARLDDLALALDPAHVTVTNPPTYATRFSSAASKWQKWSGSTWGDLASTYAINVATADKLATARSIALTGDGTGTQNFDGSAGISIALTLATVNSNVGSFGSANAITTFTANAKGLITAAGTVALTSGTGIQRGNGSGGLTAAGAAEIVAAIGTTAVTNATNATNATTAASCSGNAATATMATTVPSSSTSGTAVAADRGKTIKLSAGITIANATHAEGDIISLYNNTAGSLTITQGASFTLRQAGTANTGNRTLAQRGIATLWFVSSSEAVISGSGVT